MTTTSFTVEGARLVVLAEQRRRCAFVHGEKRRLRLGQIEMYTELVNISHSGRTVRIDLQ